METTFDSQDCDEVIQKPSKWSNEKLKALWASLLNLEAVSKACEDIELQGILLLLETIFSIFKRLKNKHDTTESSYIMMKHEFDARNEELQQVKEELKRCKNSSCKKCLELEKELQTLKKKQENNENRIKSIVNILSMNYGSEDSDSSSQADQHPVVAKAFNLVSQMLLGEETKFGTKREYNDTTGNNKVRTPVKKKKKLKIDILGLKEAKKETDIFIHGEILHPETLPMEEERNLNTKNEKVPETLDCTERIIPVTNLKHNENLSDIESTPKKQATQIAEASSPILGGSNKKSACLNSHISSSPQEYSSDECTLTYESARVTGKSTLKSKSPSLLKPQCTTSSVVPEIDKPQESNAKLETKASIPVKSSKENLKKADFWKLQPSSHSSGVEGGNRKLKQTVLSLARHPKKNDLSALKEFNGGVRQSLNESDFLADKINGDCDEETSLRLAIQESLNDKENMERGVEKKNLAIESAEDDDDFIFQSPKARHKRFNPRIRNLFNKKGNSASSISPRKKQSNSLQEKNTDETFFVPLFTSTMKEDHSNREEIKQIPESSDMSSEKLLQELGRPADRCQEDLKHDNSFDRIPERVCTSPNYKYRRNACRKKEDRQKLDGWECEQCKNYYNLAGENLNPAEMKQRLKLCSKHRDKYPVCSTTPPGYWDIKLLDTEMTRVEDKIK